MRIENAVSSEMIWATPILTAQIAGAPELNKRLADAIISREIAIRAGNATPVAGLTEGITTHWMEYNVLTWEETACAEFRSIVLKELRRYMATLGDPEDPSLAIAGIACWANILRFGEGLTVHHHDPGFVSAHYLVQCGAPADDSGEGGVSGYTTYFRPGYSERMTGIEESAPKSPWEGEWSFSDPPQEGRLFFFPSYVHHAVQPNLSRTPRISIALDVYLRRQETRRGFQFSPPRWFRPESA
jgi:hypothetical protein